METTYAFSAYNTEVLYGYGTCDEATLYLEWLNKGKSINLYEMGVSDLTEDQADTLAINLRETLADFSE